MALMNLSTRDRGALTPLAGWPSPVRATGIVPTAYRLWNRYRAWRARRETIRQLAALDERTLRDLNVTPREIESLVYSESDDRTHSYDRNWWRNQGRCAR